MNVTALRHDAVFVNPGSYRAMPAWSSVLPILPRSAALTVPSVMGSSYSSPVRLSRTVSVGLSVTMDLLCRAGFRVAHGVSAAVPT